MDNIEKEESVYNIYRNIMKAKEVIEKYKITRRTLSNWVKKGIIGVNRTPSGRYIYFEKNTNNDEKL